jgi:hypothetical protein
VCLSRQVRPDRFVRVEGVSGGGAPSFLAFGSLSSEPLASSGSPEGVSPLVVRRAAEIGQHVSDAMPKSRGTAVPAVLAPSWGNPSRLLYPHEHAGVYRCRLWWCGGHRPPSPRALLDIRVVGLGVLAIVPI